MGQSGGARGPALAALLVAAGAGLSLLRQPGAGALDTVYAEDGTVFLGEAYRESTVDALASPYAGYLHAIPRLIAEPVSALPTSAAAVGLALGAAVVTGLFALLVFVASGRFLPSLSARLLASAVVVLVPVGQDEILNSIANLHWAAFYVLFWLLLWRPRTVAGQVVSAVTILLIVLSDPMTVVFLPLAVWRWLSGRDGETATAAMPVRERVRLGWLWAGRLWRWPAVAPVLAMLVGLAAQAAAVLFGPGGRELTPEPVMWAPWWGVRAVPTGLLGQRWFGSDVDTGWLVLAVVAWVVIAVLVAVSLRGRATETGGELSPGRLAGLAAAHCVAVYALPVALSGQATPRYAVAPAMLLAAALAAITLRHKAAHAVFIVLCLVVWAVNLRVPNERGQGPQWSDELPRACTGTVVVPITPAGWEMAVPCRD